MKRPSPGKGWTVTRVGSMTRRIVTPTHEHDESACSGYTSLGARGRTCSTWPRRHPGRGHQRRRRCPPWVRMQMLRANPTLVGRRTGLHVQVHWPSSPTATAQVRREPHSARCALRAKVPNVREVVGRVLGCGVSWQRPCRRPGNPILLSHSRGSERRGTSKPQSSGFRTR